jgi:hypothetical protein
MVNLNNVPLPHPDRVREILLDGMEEVMGHSAVEETLKQAASTCSPKASLQPGNVAHILEVVEAIYGTYAGYGLALCIGKACTKYGLRAFGSELGLDGLDFRLRPPAVRINLGLELLAHILQQLYGICIRIDQNPRSYQWVMPGEIMDTGKQASPAAGYLVMGILQEFLYWAGGGRFYPLEVAVSAANELPAFVITIAKKALD